VLVLNARSIVDRHSKHFAEIGALRLASEKARLEYLTAQYRLLVQLRTADGRRVRWPSASEYEAVAALGRMASLALRAYLDRVHVPPKPARTAAERVLLIHSLSEHERLWQPTPDEWLKQQGFR